MTAPFDTLAFADRLETAGLDRAVAKAVSTAMAEVAMVDLVTKADLNDAVHQLTLRGIGGLAALGGLLLAAFALF